MFICIRFDTNVMLTKKTLSHAERSCRKSPLSHTRSEKVISSALLKCINACEAAKGMSHYPNEIPQDSCHCYCDQNVDKPCLSQCIRNCNSVMDVASRHRRGIFCQRASLLPLVSHGMQEYLFATSSLVVCILPAYSKLMGSL